ncbi:MAG: hypothetical protein IJ247_03465 [Bacilli bacterium]|nr:hypothetical protein [Bacilli bacterium]
MENKWICQFYNGYKAKICLSVTLAVVVALFALCVIPRVPNAFPSLEYFEANEGYYAGSFALVPLSWLYVYTFGIPDIPGAITICELGICIFLFVDAIRELFGFKDATFLGKSNLFLVLLVITISRIIEARIGIDFYFIVPLLLATFYFGFGYFLDLSTCTIPKRISVLEHSMKAAGACVVVVLFLYIVSISSNVALSFSSGALGYGPEPTGFLKLVLDSSARPFYDNCPPLLLVSFLLASLTFAYAIPMRNHLIKNT